MRILCILALLGFLGCVRGEECTSNAQLEEDAKKAAETCTSILSNIKTPPIPVGLTSLTSAFKNAKLDIITIKQDPGNPTEITLTVKISADLTLGSSTFSVSVNGSINTSPKAVDGDLQLTTTQSGCKCSTTILNLSLDLKSLEASIISLVSPPIHAAVSTLLQSVNAQIQAGLSLRNRLWYTAGGSVGYVLNAVKVTAAGLVRSVGIILNGQKAIPASTAASPDLQQAETCATYLSDNAISAALSQLKISFNKKLSTQESKLFGDQEGLSIKIELGEAPAVTIDAAGLQLALSAGVSVSGPAGPLIDIKLNLKIGGAAVTKGNGIGVTFDPDDAKIEPGTVTASPDCKCPTVTADPLLALGLHIRVFLELFRCNSHNLLSRPSVSTGPVENKPCTYELNNLRCGQTPPKAPTTS